MALQRRYADVYLGQLATGCLTPSDGSSVNKQIMSRSMHYARDRITSLQLVYPYWHALETVLSGGANASVEASIEYPSGTFTRVKFSGIDSGVLPPGGTVTSDAVSVSIPSGAQFWVRTYLAGANGISYSGAAGGAANWGVSGVSNLVMSAGSFTTPGANYAYAPIAIIGYTDKPSVAILGDSIAAGTGDDITAQYKGFLARAFGPSYGFINLAAGGDSATACSGTGFNRRSALVQYCTHVVSNLGTNDVYNSGRSAAQTLSAINTFFAKNYFVGKAFYQTTILPRSTSSDAYVTEANQTTAANNSVRVTLNNSIKSDGVTGAQAIIDSTTEVESRSTTGIWQAPDGVALLNDGTHPIKTGVMRMVTLTHWPKFTR